MHGFSMFCHLSNSLQSKFEYSCLQQSLTVVSTEHEMIQLQLQCRRRDAKALALRIANLPATLPLQLFPTLGSKAEESPGEARRNRGPFLLGLCGGFHKWGYPQTDGL